MNLDLHYPHDQLAKVAGELDLELVIAFGSRSGGRLAPGEESDLDIAVLTGRDNEKPVFEVSRALSDVFSGFALDLVLLHRVDALFRLEIMQNSTLLYGDPMIYYEYRAFAYRDFVDSADLRELEEILFRKKMAYLRAAVDAQA